MNEDYLKFETDHGNIAFQVYGDCCSHCYFHDFVGVEKLLRGNPVVSVKAISLEREDSKIKVNRNDSEEIECYCYEIVTEDPQFGEVTSVFSFRNSSNGYYGGSLENAPDDIIVAPQIYADVLEASSGDNVINIEVAA
ncbi:hypothetical protein ACNHQB_19430 [Mycolicibacterium sp. A43C]